MDNWISFSDLVSFIDVCVKRKKEPFNKHTMNKEKKKKKEIQLKYFHCPHPGTKEYLFLSEDKMDFMFGFLTITPASGFSSATDPSFYQLSLDNLEP